MKFTYLWRFLTRNKLESPNESGQDYLGLYQGEPISGTAPWTSSKRHVLIVVTEALRFWGEPNMKRYFFKISIAMMKQYEML